MQDLKLVTVLIVEDDFADQKLIKMSKWKRDDSSLEETTQ